MAGAESGPVAVDKLRGSHSDASLRREEQGDAAKASPSTVTPLGGPGGEEGAPHVEVDASGVVVGVKEGGEGRKGRVRQHMQARRERKASNKALDPQLEAYMPLIGVNLRDVGAVTGDPLRPGRLYRSSELLSKDEMKSNEIKTILDLRRMDRPCKQDPAASKAVESTKTIIKYMLLGPQKLIPEKRLLYVHRAHPHPCPVCRGRACRRFGTELQVIHADLIPSTVGLRIFQAMPPRVQAKAIVMACFGKGAASVIAPAVANPLLLGYKALYRTLLEDSKRGMALALRPFADDANYPVLVHCIHGKDRTGLIIMLLLLLCGVPAEVIVDDYVLSESVLKESRLHDELRLDVYLTSDDVIAATRETMEATIAYVVDKWGGAEGYMQEIGLEQWEIDRIRANLMKGAPRPEQPPPPPLRPRFSIGSLLHLTRRGSAPAGQLQEAVGRRSLARRSSPLADAPALARLSTDGETALPDASDTAPVPPAEPEARFLRRASLANSGPGEIRSMLRHLREQHPQLGSVSESGPVDFLRLSPPPGASRSPERPAEPAGEASDAAAAAAADAGQAAEGSPAAGSPEGSGSGSGRPASLDERVFARSRKEVLPSPFAAAADGAAPQQLR